MKVKKCQGDSCPFLKTKEEAQADMKAVNRRLRGLYIKEQESISDKYYNGRMPWNA